MWCQMELAMFVTIACGFVDERPMLRSGVHLHASVSVGSVDVRVKRRRYVRPPSMTGFLYSKC